MSGIGNLSDIIPYISPPPEKVVETVGGVPGVYIAITVFVLGLVAFGLIGWYILIFVFGQPVRKATEASKGGALILQFDTPKSAQIEVSTIGGGGFQYKDVAKGTVSATPDSVMNIAGRQAAFTYSSMGVTISPKLLLGVSCLVNQGIDTLEAMKQQYTETIQQATPALNEDGTPQLDEHGKNIEEIYNVQVIGNKTLMSGYDFTNFDILLKQTGEEMFIPLCIDGVPAFITTNITAEAAEEELSIFKSRARKGMASGIWDIMKWVLPMAILIFASTVIK